MSAEMNSEKELGSVWGRGTPGRRNIKYQGPEVHMNWYTFEEQDVGTWSRVRCWGSRGAVALVLSVSLAEPGQHFPEFFSPYGFWKEWVYCFFLFFFFFF